LRSCQTSLGRDNGRYTALRDLVKLLLFPYLTLCGARDDLERLAAVPNLGEQKASHVHDLEPAPPFAGLFEFLEVVDILRIQLLLGQELETGSIGRVETAKCLFVA
jgi:hypothetical protein